MHLPSLPIQSKIIIYLSHLTLLHSIHLTYHADQINVYMADELLNKCACDHPHSFALARTSSATNDKDAKNEAASSSSFRGSRSLLIMKRQRSRGLR